MERTERDERYAKIKMKNSEDSVLWLERSIHISARFKRQGHDGYYALVKMFTELVGKVLLPMATK